MQKEEFSTKGVAALPDLFTWTDQGVRLLSAKCSTCNTYFFPQYHEQHRPGCSREQVKPALLSKVGKLASYTVQFYMPPLPFKTAKDITPYVIGLVEFPEGIQVSGIVTNYRDEDLKLGREMETTTYALYKNDEGQDVVTWAFQPSRTN